MHSFWNFDNPITGFREPSRGKQFGAYSNFNIIKCNWFIQKVLFCGENQEKWCLNLEILVSESMSHDGSTHEFQSDVEKKAFYG